MKKLFLSLSRWVVFSFFTMIVLFMVIASLLIINRLRKQEIQRVEAIATAMSLMQDDEMNDPKTLELVLTIVKDNQTIPIILTDQYKRPILAEGTHRNIPKNVMKDPEKLQQMIEEMGQNYQPFLIKMPNGKNQYIFYSHSQLLDYLQYYPWALAIFIGGYLFFSFWFLRMIKRTDENYLWAGLAKETAHQIGTPLSSMLGWIEVLKNQYQGNQGITEIEKDIQRLVVISERFSKIGSVPELNELNLKETIQQTYDYLRARISTQVQFGITLPEAPVLFPHNRVLISWVIENLVKNAVDAMRGVGRVDLVMIENENRIEIEIKDTGCGMSSAQARSVFRAGYSTKKRGWGLGLSLVKRVISEYHGGEVRVLSSVKGKGTIFQISFENKE